MMTFASQEAPRFARRTTSAVTRAGESVSEARELARWLLRSLRDRVPQTEEDARITVGSNALLN